MRGRLAIALVLLPLALAACGGGGGSGNSGDGGSGSNETVLASRQASSTIVIVTSSDQTLYNFSGKSCDGQCADIWHPMVASGDVVVEKDSGLDQKLVGTQERSDGKKQVTYDGHALYIYSKEQPSQVTGVGDSFGGHWSVATAANPFQRQTTTGTSCEPNCGY